MTPTASTPLQMNTCVMYRRIRPGNAMEFGVSLACSAGVALRGRNRVRRIRIGVPAEFGEPHGFPTVTIRHHEPPVSFRVLGGLTTGWPGAVITSKQTWSPAASAWAPRPHPHPRAHRELT